MLQSMKVIDLHDKLSLFAAPWQPKIIAELNGQHAKLAKLQGEFIWHCHDDADELFLVLEGELEMRFRDQVLRLSPGQMVVVPRGVEHCPSSAAGCSVLLLEPAGTVNTGDAGGDRTVADPDWI
jgi:mannose-6-phosphate isomerase-like protein (cupin superfamily)